MVLPTTNAGACMKCSKFTTRQHCLSVSSLRIPKTVFILLELSLTLPASRAWDLREDWERSWMAEKDGYQSADKRAL